ncbi:MAG: GDP-L-fucose synthase [Desulfobacteraceae bacterium]|jgi:GDP-L-fucose synthase
MEKNSKIFVAGHRGLVGSALVRELEHQGYTDILTRTHADLDLEDIKDVDRFFLAEKPQYVFLAAAKVGGILANNTYPAEFIYKNLMIQNHVIHNSYKHGVNKLVFLGSSCIYPRLCPQPMKEDHLMTGPLESTNSPYAVAKIAGIEMCWAYNRQYGTRFIPVMPTNLYGPNDNFDLETSHVLPALIRKFHEAKESQADNVVVWGTGKPRREFLHVDDMASACVYLMNKASYSDLDLKSILFNIGTGEDVSIRQLTDMIKNIVGFKGEILWDDSKPDGTPQKLLDVSRLKAQGWEAEISLEAGLQRTYAWYVDQTKN